MARDERRPEHHAGRLDHPQPCRPAQPAALDDWIEQAHQCRAQQRHAPNIQAQGGFRPRIGHPAHRGEEDDDADRHVDEKHTAPAESGNVDGYQPPSQQRTDDSGKPGQLRP